MVKTYRIIWLLLTTLSVCNAAIDESFKSYRRGDMKEISIEHVPILRQSIKRLMMLPENPRKHPNTADNHHVIIARNIGVHSVINDRLQEQKADFRGNVTRNEDLEIQKARITVVVSCSLMLLTTAIFAVFVYLRVKSKRPLKVGVIESGVAGTKSCPS